MLYVCSNTRCGWRRKMKAFLALNASGPCICAQCQAWFCGACLCCGSLVGLAACQGGPVQWWGSIAARLWRGSSLHLDFFFFRTSSTSTSRRILYTRNTAAGPHTPLPIYFDISKSRSVIPVASLRNHQATMATTQIKVVFATQNADLQLPEEKRQLVVPSGPVSPMLPPPLAPCPPLLT